jgi:hypothetical protein
MEPGGRAELPGTHQFPRGSVTKIESLVEADLDVHGRVPERVGHRARRGRRGGQGLLREDVLSGGRRRHHDLGLHGGAGGDQHRVDPRVTQQVTIVRVAPGNPESVGEHLKLSGVAPADSHHGELGDLRQREEMLFRDDRTRPDDAEP